MQGFSASDQIIKSLPWRAQLSFIALTIPRTVFKKKQSYCIKLKMAVIPRVVGPEGRGVRMQKHPVFLGTPSPGPPSPQRGSLF
jgi:hypothetical protein